MKKCFSILFLLISNASYLQAIPDFEAIDSLYREDQFYITTSYAILVEHPSGVSQNSFSTGITVGFLRDFPINKKRTLAVAPGLGFSFSNYKENLIVSENLSTRDYAIIPSGTDYDKNKLSFYAVEIPLEFRWRTSTFESHKFWRIYSGIKASYIFYNKSKYSSNNANFTVVNNPDINKMHYGIYIATGFNTWNFYTYYGLSSFFKNDLLGSNKNLKTLNIGLIFYIL